MKNRRALKFMMCMLAVWFFIQLHPVQASAGDDLLEHPSCRYCGMDRTKFVHSRAYITYDDNTTTGTCSLHCAAVDLSLKIDLTPLSIMVADYNTATLIDADKSYWVVGGRKMGVMSKRAKWVFTSQAAAQEFISAYGGNPATFPQAVKAAFEDMWEDLRMIRNKRQRMKMGKRH